jgi:hypothetical protein
MRVHLITGLPNMILGSTAMHSGVMISCSRRGGKTVVAFGEIVPCGPDAVGTPRDERS